MEQIFIVKQLFDGMDGGIRADQAVCVENGKVESVCPATELSAACAANAQLFGRHIMLPAFIDAHDHGRGVSPAALGAVDEALELWIPNLVRVTTPIAEAAYYEGLLLSSSGVGTVVHLHNYDSLSDCLTELVDTAEGYIRAGVKAVVCPAYVDQNSAVYHDRDGFIRSLPNPLKEEFSGIYMDSFYTLSTFFELVDRLIERLSDHIAAGRAAVQLQPVGAQWCSDEALIAMRDYAVKKGIGIQMHLLETRYQKLYATKRFGCGMVRHLKDIGFLGPWLTCAHAVWLNGEDMELIRDSGTKCVTNPSSNLRLRSGQADLARMLKTGLISGIGLDGCSYDDDQDYIREMRTALLNPHDIGVSASLCQRDILRMAGQNGAQIAGGTLSPGCIAEGRPADMVLMDLDRLRSPYTDDGADTLELIFRKGTRRDIAAVYINGECVAKNGEPLRGSLADAAEALREATAQRRRDMGAIKKPSRELMNRIKNFYAAWEEEE